MFKCRSQWPRGLRRGSAVPRLLRLWVRIPSGTCLSVCCKCCVFSGRGLCGELIACTEESYRLWWVGMCDTETTRMWRPGPALGRSATGKNELFLHTRNLFCKPLSPRGHIKFLKYLNYKKKRTNKKKKVGWRRAARYYMLIQVGTEIEGLAV